MAPFGLALAIHVASFVSRDPGQWVGPDWVFPIASIVLLVAMVLAGNRVDAAAKPRAHENGVPSADQNPWWFSPVLWVFIAYALLNAAMLIFGEASRGELVRQSDDRYFVHRGHGRPPVPITAGEYHRLRRLRARRGSAVLMAMFLGIGADMLFTLTGQKRFRTGSRWRAVVIEMRGPS